jgi:hypothetical protein
VRRPEVGPPSVVYFLNSSFVRNAAGQDHAPVVRGTWMLGLFGVGLRLAQGGKAKAGGDGVHPVQHQISHDLRHFGGHAKTDLEPAPGHEMPSPIRAQFATMSRMEDRKKG